MKNKSKRSPKFPGHTVEETLIMFSKIAPLASGENKELTEKEKMLNELGFSGPSGPARRALAALVGYGLLDRKPLRISELGQRVLASENPADEEGLLEHLALNPPMFARLFQRARGMEPEEVIKRMIERGFTPQGAERAVQIYAANAAFCGLDASAPDLPPPEARRRRRRRMMAKKAAMAGMAGVCVQSRRGGRPERGKRGERGERGPQKPVVRYVFPLGPEQEVELRFSNRPKPEEIAALRDLLAVVENQSKSKPRVSE